MEANSTILLVEDSEDDFLLFERALRATGLPFDVQGVGTCAEGRDYLLGAGRFADRETFPFPKLIMADNCGAPFDTAAFLRWLRRHPECRVIPIVMLSGSRDPKLIETAYEHGVHSFFEKPARNSELRSLLKMILDYWAAALVPEAVQECKTDEELDQPHMG